MPVIEQRRQLTDGLTWLARHLTHSHTGNLSPRSGFRVSRTPLMLWQEGQGIAGLMRASTLSFPKDRHGPRHLQPSSQDRTRDYIAVASCLPRRGETAATASRVAAG